MLYTRHFYSCSEGLSPRKTPSAFFCSEPARNFQDTKLRLSRFDYWQHEQACSASVYVVMAGALQVAEALRAAVEASAIPHEANSRGYLTGCIGVATLMPISETDPQLLIKLADAALYRAKSQGRNRVIGSDAVEVAKSSNEISIEKRLPSKA
jgi:hypothetical protein